MQRFDVLGIKGDEKMSEKNFKLVFKDLQLEDDEISKIMVQYIGSNQLVSDFCQVLKADGKPSAGKKFTKMNPAAYNQLKPLVRKINQRRNRGKECRWRKLERL